MAGLPLGVADTFRSLAPALVCLEGGVWMQSSEEDSETDDDDRRHQDFREKLIEKLQAFEPHGPVLYAITANKINDVAEHLYAVGVFDRRFEVPSPPLEFIGNEFIAKIGRDLCAESLTGALGKVGKLVSGRDSARDLLAQEMCRLARCEGRQVEFVDLVNFKTRGTTESDDAPLEAKDVPRQVAHHEAGHALVAIVDSGGRNIPEYSTIVAGEGFKGVVVQSYGYHYQRGDQETYRDFRRGVRICLAGRAGEQLLVGPEGICDGATGDLESATELTKLVFARFGYAPGMEDPAKVSSNLAVWADKPSPSECAHVEVSTREYLAEQYGIVLAMLKAHRQFCSNEDALLDTFPIRSAGPTRPNPKTINLW